MPTIRFLAGCGGDAGDEAVALWLKPLGRWTYVFAAHDVARAWGPAASPSWRCMRRTGPSFRPA